MKIRLLVVFFVLRWTTMEAKQNSLGYPGNDLHIAGCHIESVDHEKKYLIKAAAEAAKLQLEQSGVKPDFLRVDETKAEPDGL